MTETEIFNVIKKALPDRVFFMRAPMGTREPYLIFQRISQIPQNDLRGYANADLVRYQVDSYAVTHQDAAANMAIVVALLRALPDAPLVQNGQDMEEGDTRIHRTMIEITTWYDGSKVEL